MFFIITFVLFDGLEYWANFLGLDAETLENSILSVTCVCY